MSNPQGAAADACCMTPPLLREPLTAPAAVEMAKKLKALADPVRLRLFSAIASHAGGEACVCDISGDIDVSQPTVSHHLKVLRDAGLLTSERRASWVYYAVIPEALREISALLDLNTVALAGATA
ncbi:helix-turn-helix transcriptional regulator [Mycolicibacterium sp. S2-37]|uniref:ArsR/SmtB family transcription factor n=1 Tax=Mycolicibacterium sp. S2-37 TaxID=2810297 RepID=UPI001A94088A|nr:metalloregulator ArsR/SmtB family transcription factor [Mycolicibacterium sp. S2-37]MBO0678300.1 helix-turn-helix transcriptional regulator [Mycolicibacterium sp. S2-37]